MTTPTGPFGRVALVAALLAVTAIIAACSTSAHAGPAPSSRSTSQTSDATISAPKSIPAGSSAQSMVIGGQHRTYRVYRPTSLPASAPLVVVLHGALGTGQQAESSYGWDAQADKAHFIVAYPDGYKRTWNVSDGCCGPPAAENIDDVAFITAVVHAISGALPVDPKQVFATGISNGGALAYRLACNTTIFAAIGPDSTDLLGECPSPAPISVIHIHGSADMTFPYNGGAGKRDNGGTGTNPADTAGPPIPQMIGRWRSTDHCASPASNTTGAITTSTATCPDDRAVELITIAGAGHQWPGQPDPSGPLAGKLDPPYPGLNATATIWAFFRAHPKGS